MTRRCLATRFGLLGAFLGKYPLTSVGLCILAIFTPCFLGFWLGLRLEIGLDEGFVPKNAPSRREISIQKQFFGENDQSKEWYMALFGIARPKGNGTRGNMLDSANYEEFNGFYERMTKMELTGAFGGNFSYSRICHPLCEINDQMQKLMDHSWMAMFVKMQYPVSRVFSFDVNIGKHVFNRTVNSKGELVGAEFIAFYFTSFIRDETRAQELAQFERAVKREAEAHNSKPGSRVELIAHGSNGVQEEMSRGVLDAARNKLIGLLLGAIAFLAVHFTSGWLHSQFPVRRFLLAFLCLLSLPFGQFASFSLISLFGLSVNLLHFTSPLFCVAFLFSAHGTFQIADVWCRMVGESKRKQFTASERLGSTFEQLSAPFLLTQLDPILGFALISPLLPAQHYRTFALGLSILLLFGLFIQLALFSPLLSRFCHHQIDHVRFVNGSPTVLEFGPNDPVAKKPSIAEHPPIVKLRAKNGHELIPAATNGQLRVNKRREKRLAAKQQIRRTFNKRIIYPLANFLRSSHARILVLFLTSFFLGFVLFRGIPSLKNNMDYRRLLPQDSPAIRGFDLMDNIWMDFLQILYIVNQPPDFEDPEEFRQFKEFLSTATALPQAMPPNAHMSWLFDYSRDRLKYNLLDRMSSNHSQEIVDMSKFHGFINGFPYRAWQSGVKYKFHQRMLNGNETLHPSIDQMLVMIAYNESRGLAGKQSLINKCRAVAIKFPQFRIAVFDTDLRTADIMDTIEPVIWRSFAGMIVTIFLCSLLTFWQFGSSILVTCSAVSILAQLFGFGYLLGFQLDLLTIPTALAIAALAIHLGVQFIGELQSCWAKDDPFRHSFAHSAATMAKTSILWLAISLPPLLLAQVPFFGLQSSLLLLAAALAIWHCLFLLPILAGILPQNWLN